VHDKPEDNPLFKKLREHQIPVFSDPDRAAAVLWALYKRYRYLEKCGAITPEKDVAAPADNPHT
jgi:hypothetical protein